MKKVSSWFQICIFLAFIFLFFVLHLALPDVGFSEQENRELTQAPKLTVDSSFSGQFTSKFESYCSDQFPFRDSWTTLKARSELSLGKKENKGVYLCGDDILVEGYSKPDFKQLDTNITAVRNLAEKANIPVYFALVPSFAEIRSDLLPKNAPNDSQKEIIDYSYEGSGTINIDLLSAMSAHSDEYIYYRTDHHWTSLGAYYGYAAIMEAMGKTAPTLSNYNREMITDEFYGSVYSKSGISWVGSDSIEFFVPQREGTKVLNYPSDEAVPALMYNMDFLNKKDKYSMFMGGNTPLITVNTENTDAPSILVLRDSYFDSLIPFLQDNYSEVHAMDLRYYKTKLMYSTLIDYIEEHNIDEVLVCYSLYNFGTDNNVFLMGQ
ncbi:MAG: hypothetical protein GX025_05830 [Clostridiales bacterium]|nr:hypothetical protein [Clostridiales bacterium]